MGLVPNRKLDISDFTAANGVVKQVATKGDVVVDLSKVEVFARGKSKPFTNDLKQELRDLNAFKQANRKGFDLDPNNQARLKDLGRIRDNSRRSQELASSLDSVGLTDNVANNDLIINHILDVGQNVTSANRVQFPSILSGPKGGLKVLSTFSVFDDGTKFLSSINFIPKEK